MSGPRTHPSAGGVRRGGKCTSGKGRRWTGLIQAACGAVVMTFSIIAMQFDYPETSYNPDFSFEETSIFYMENSVIGIWAGAIFIITGILGLLSKNNRCLVLSYLCASVIACLLAVFGLLVSASSVSHTHSVRRVLTAQDDRVYVGLDPCSPEPIQRCCVSHRYRCTEHHGSDYGSSYSDGGIHGGSSDADYQPQMDCDGIQDEYSQCQDEALFTADVKFPLYVIVTCFFGLEILAGILGAVFTCPRLSTCCRPTPTPAQVIFHQPPNGASDPAVHIGPSAPPLLPPGGTVPRQKPSAPLLQESHSEPPPPYQGTG